MAFPVRSARSARVASLVLLALTLGTRPAQADPASTDFTWDLRFGGYLAANSNQFAYAALGGFQLGATHWFADSNVGLIFLAGPQGGYMSTALGVLAVTGEGGVIFALSGSHRYGTTISLTWAPKLMFDYSFHQFGKGEVASPFGFEAAFNFSGFKIPIWFLETLDGTSFVGTSFGLGY
jgi:hypothetical protein